MYHFVIVEIQISTYQMFLKGLLFVDNNSINNLFECHLQSGIKFAKYIFH